MESKSQAPKLSLKKETITKLNDDQMRKVIGGTEPSSSTPQSCSTNSCNGSGSGSCGSYSCNAKATIEIGGNA